MTIFKLNNINLNIDILNKIITKETDMLTGNILFIIFNIMVDTHDHEIYSINESSENNLEKILISSGNTMCYHMNHIYVTKEIKDIMDMTKYSEEYRMFMYRSHMKQHYDIYDMIRRLDMNGFNDIKGTQFQHVKIIDNKPMLPINYCMKFLYPTI